MSKARDNASNKGSTLEVLSSVCDGSTITVPSGTYTFQNVTVIQGLTNSYADVNGSVMNYTPPPGATRVVYRFNFHTAWNAFASAHAISHYRFYIGGTEVSSARSNTDANYLEGRFSFEWVINIGGSTNTDTGRQATWTTPKQLKIMSRSYLDGTNDINLHGTYYWDGGAANQLSIPTLTIEAIA